MPRKKKPGWVVETQIGDDDFAGIGILRLEGVSEPEGVDARDTIEEAMTRLVDEGECTTVIVDGANLEWLTADVAGAILQDLARLRDAGGDIVFLAFPADVREFLEQLHVVKDVRFLEGELDDVAGQLADERSARKPAAKATPKVSPQRSQIRVEKEGDVAVVVVAGAIDAKGAPAFQAAVENALASSDRVLIDGSDLASASSTAIALLVKLSEAGKGKTLALVATGAVRAIVDVLGLSVFFKVFSDRKSALAALGKAAKGGKAKGSQRSKKPLVSERGRVRRTGSSSRSIPTATGATSTRTSSTRSTCRSSRRG